MHAVFLEADNLGGISVLCPAHPKATLSINQVGPQEAAWTVRSCFKALQKFDCELTALFWKKQNPQMNKVNIKSDTVSCLMSKRGKIADWWDKKTTSFDNLPMICPP